MSCEKKTFLIVFPFIITLCISNVIFSLPAAYNLTSCAFSLSAASPCIRNTKNVALFVSLGRPEQNEKLVTLGTFWRSAEAKCELQCSGPVRPDKTFLQISNSASLWEKSSFFVQVNQVFLCKSALSLCDPACAVAMRSRRASKALWSVQIFFKVEKEAVLEINTWEESFMSERECFLIPWFAPTLFSCYHMAVSLF